MILMHSTNLWWTKGEKLATKRNPLDTKCTMTEILPLTPRKFEQCTRTASTERIRTQCTSTVSHQDIAGKSNTRGSRTRKVVCRGTNKFVIPAQVSWDVRMLFCHVRRRVVSRTLCTRVSSRDRDTNNRSPRYLENGMTFFKTLGGHVKTEWLWKSNLGRKIKRL